MDMRFFLRAVRYVSCGLLGITIGFGAIGCNPSSSAPPVNQKSEVPLHPARVQWKSDNGGVWKQGFSLGVGKTSCSRGSEGHEAYSLTCIYRGKKDKADLYEFRLTIPKKNDQPLLLTRHIEFRGATLVVFDQDKQTVLVCAKAGQATAESRRANDGAGITP